VTLVLSRRRLIAGCCGAAAFASAQVWDYASEAWEVARVARFKARNAATAKAIAARLLRSVQAHKAVSGAVFAGGSRYLLSSGLDHSNTGEPTLRLWQVDTGKLVMNYNGHSGGVAGIAVTRDGLHALSAGYNDGTIKYWDLTKAQEIKSFSLVTEFRTRAALRSIAFASNETDFAVGGVGLLRLCDLATGAQIWDYREIFENMDEIRSIALTSDGFRLIATGLETRLVDVADGRMIANYRHPNATGGLSFAYASATSGSVALYNDSELRRLDLTTGSEVTIKHENANGIRSIAFSPDGTLALVGGEWTPLTLITVASGEAAFEFSTPGAAPSTTALAISPDGQTAVVGEHNRGTLSFYDLSGLVPIASS
jgi:WD40 repeat protein